MNFNQFDKKIQFFLFLSFQKIYFLLIVVFIFHERLFSYRVEKCLKNSLSEGKVFKLFE